MKKIFMAFVAILIIICGIIITLNILYPIEDIDLILKYSDKNNVDPALICAMIRTESGFDSEAESHKGANGYMQIMESTAIWGAEVLGIEDFDYSQINEPEINIAIGTWYISKLIDQYGDTDTALAAYNAGSGNVSGWLQNENYSEDGKTLCEIPYEETRNYVKKVDRSRKVYSFLLNMKGYI